MSLPYLFGCILVTMSPQAAAQADTLVEKTVVAIKPDIILTCLGQDRETVRSADVLHAFLFRVQKAEGDRLQVRVSGLEGWVPKADVVPFDEAEAYFSKRLDKDPKDGAAHALRGLVRAQKGETDKAFTDYDEAIRLQPEASYPYALRAAAWMGKVEFAKARADYDQAIRLGKDHAALYHGRGNLWYVQKDYDKALVDHEEAIRLDPLQPWFFHNRGWDFFRKKQYDKALADYEEELRLDPKEAAFFRDRGNVAFVRQQYDKALADFDEAIRLSPNYAMPYYNRARTWSAKKAYDKALADYDAAIRLAPRQMAIAYAARAWIWAACPEEKYRDGKKAIGSAKQACELSGQADHYAALAAAHAEAGDFAAAEKAQQKAIELTSEEEKAVYRARLQLYQNKQPFRLSDK
jgi:tetratricopeptide (TPR) repeat protein